MKSKKISGIKAVLFDFDDTLVGTIKAKWAQHKFIAKEYYGKDLTDEELIANWGMPMDQLVTILYEVRSYEEARLHILKHREEYPKILFDTSIRTILELKKRGFMTGVVTATNKESIDLDFRLNNFTGEHFDYVQTLDDTKFHKPDPRVFEPAVAWLAERELRPNQTLYVGDSKRDMEAALGAGFKFIGVETGLVTAEDFAGYGAVSVPNNGGVLDLVSS